MRITVQTIRTGNLPGVGLGTSGPSGGKKYYYSARFMMFGIGMQELLIVLVIVVVIFGSSRLPQLGEGFGKMITNFRKSTRDAVKPDDSENDDESKTISNS